MTMPDEMPDDLAALDARIGEDMLFAARCAAAAAEMYALDRSLDPEPDLTGIPAWSEVSEPGTVEYGPFTPPPEPPVQ